MNPWRPFPLIRLLIPVAAGTSSGLLVDVDFRIPFIIFIFLLVFLAIPVFIKFRKWNFKFQWITGLFIYSIIAFLSFEITIRKNDIFHPAYFRSEADGKFFWIGSLAEPAVQKQKTTKIIVYVEVVCRNGVWKKTVGKALAYIKRDSRSEALFYGDRILGFSEFTLPASASFPGSFDQKKFLDNQRINYISYITAGNWKPLACMGKQTPQRMALSFRNKLLQILKDHNVSGREFAVSAALLLGYVDEIDRELMKDYSATGAMHILSVSGMHVGVIFLVLDKLLGFLGRSKKGLLSKTVFIITVIWAYAMITGLSPAVMRAAVMISLVVTGKAMKRQPDILNILASSFIFLLIIDPTLLFNAGFQLSYLAVAGIVLLYKPVYDLYVTSNNIADKIWSVIAVSIAAQVITFPLSFFYFHQFPNYFMITNILVVPLSSMIIYTGILLLLLDPVPFVSFCLAKLLIVSVWILNNSLHFIEELPFAVTRGIHISIWATVCIYLLVISLFLFLVQKRKMFLFMFFVFFIILVAENLGEKVGRFRTAKIIVYGSRNLPAIDFIKGGKSVFLYHPDAISNSFFSENHIMTLDKMNVRSSTMIMLRTGIAESKGMKQYGYFYKKGGFIGFNEKRICILNRKLPGNLRRRFSADILILTGNPAMSIGRILKIFTVSEIVVDPSNSRWRAENWKKEADSAGVNIHIVNETGAYVKVL